MSLLMIAMAEKSSFNLWGFAADGNITLIVAMA